MERIGFIGLGIMGKPMARNLLKSGYKLTVYNRSPAPVKELAGEGAIPAANIKELGKSCDIVITMLPDGPDVEKVCLGEDGLACTMRQWSLIIDMSSIAPVVTKRIGVVLKEKGIRMLDAPVSGGEKGAIEGTLSIMAGGSETDFNSAKPILEKMGKSVTLVGELGAGQTAKLVNQILVAIHISAMGEAFTLAAKSGIDPGKIFEAIKAGMAGSKILDVKMPMVLSRNFKPGFKMRLHQKDLQNALNTARELGLCLPLTGLIQQFLTNLVGKGRGEEDHSALVKVFEELNDITIKLP